MTLAPDFDLLGCKEAAEYLGMSQGSFWQRWHRSQQGIGQHPLPKPYWHLSTGPIWTREQIDEWKAEEEAR